MDVDVKANPNLFAAAVGMNARTVRRMLQVGELPRGGTLADWIAVYLQRLRDEAEHRLAASDLPGERARLARAQAERAEMQNAIFRAELAPVELVADARRQILGKVADMLATIPARIEQAGPHLVGELAPVRAEIARAVRLARDA
jgi:terminase small subunit / prophage DNA-packing protein